MPWGSDEDPTTMVYVLEENDYLMWYESFFKIIALEKNTVILMRRPPPRPQRRRSSHGHGLRPRPQRPQQPQPRGRGRDRGRGSRCRGRRCGRARPRLPNTQARKFGEPVTQIIGSFLPSDEFKEDLGACVWVPEHHCEELNGVTYRKIQYSPHWRRP